jgi:hypothetical protein
MRKNIYTLLLILIPAFALLLLSFSLYKPDGAPAGHSGSPGDGNNCTACHGGSAQQKSGFISTDIPMTGYVAGETYSITVTNTGTGNKGFQLTAQKQNGDALGSFIPGTDSKMAGTKHITHTAAKAADPATWTFQWTAPDPAVGDVSFYGAFVVGKPNVFVESLTVSQAQGSGLPEDLIADFSVYPNPAEKHLTLSFSAQPGKIYTAHLYNMEGKRVHQFFNNMEIMGDFSKRYRLPSNLLGGLYILELSNGETAKHKQVFIQK